MTPQFRTAFPPLALMLAIALILPGCGLFYSVEEIEAMNPDASYYDAQARAAEAAAGSVSENYVVITGNWTCSNPDPSTCSIAVKNPTAPHVPQVVQGYGAAQSLADQTAVGTKAAQIMTGIVGAAWFAAEAVNNAGDTSISADNGSSVSNVKDVNQSQSFKAGENLAGGDITRARDGDTSRVSTDTGGGQLGNDNRGQFRDQYRGQNQNQGNPIDQSDRRVDASDNRVDNRVTDSNNTVDSGNTTTTEQAPLAF